MPCLRRAFSVFSSQPGMRCDQAVQDAGQIVQGKRLEQNDILAVDQAFCHRYIRAVAGGKAQCHAGPGFHPVDQVTGGFPARHTDVGDDHIRTHATIEQCQGMVDVERGDDIAIELEQEQVDGLAHLFVVFYQQDFQLQ